jgi:tetratricopeptide (TPR) repeat protein
MLEDIVKIQPQTDRNYYADSFEFAIPIKHPKEKAAQYFKWGLVFHAKGKPAEAYKWYEKALFLHKNPFYLKQMGILHHEMGYLKDALNYIRTAIEIEKETQKQEAAKKQEHDPLKQLDFVASGSSGDSNEYVYHYASEN